MAYYVVISKVVDPAKNVELREKHLEYLEDLRGKGVVLMQGKFMDGSGGLVIYKLNSAQDLVEYVNGDPFIYNCARSYVYHEWDLVTNLNLELNPSCNSV